MTTLQTRSPYSQEELDKLYPKNLELRLVQVLLRHGERAPVSARFQNAGLAPYWPYCNAAQRLRSVAYTPQDMTTWDSLQWRRRLERFGEDDGPIIAAGPDGEVDGICQFGELTDKGRETTYDLGKRLRNLYIDQLQFMPKLISDADMIYLRATPLPRALESVQQTFWGMYPLTARTASFPPPTIVTRTPADETLFPNDGNCRRFAQLSRAFAQRAADRWNTSDDMQYINSKITKWMPQSSKTVAVDSHPRLSGIMDTINSTLAHGPETRLPSEFYDPKLRSSVEKIGVEEWFHGYNENKEYRKLGIGAQVGDIVERMISKVEGVGLSINEIGGENGQLGRGRGGETGIAFAMSGCHDTTLGGVLSSLGAFENEPWPPYTSHIAFELFREKSRAYPDPRSSTSISLQSQVQSQIKAQPQSKDTPAPKPGWLAGMLGLGSSSPSSSTTPEQITDSALKADQSTYISRRPVSELDPEEQKRLDGYYVRLRYNDKPMKIPACAKPGRHLEGDESFCTLEAFKRIADSFTPKNWKVECGQNLDGPIPGLVKGTEEWARDADGSF
ncbi:hypothetical protein H2198_001214 [Neophaeococcomyces mojaviensis]|uniref:Uncharacterized protein n=1 Tax=Neophaeococcomyces mojaviensis TaxID=3383035 RepID=A0ACC3AHQ5_9EURO|nr:hypothetical protein H2198_001214 [Knufia sp. JES_112]